MYPKEVVSATQGSCPIATRPDQKGAQMCWGGLNDDHDEFVKTSDGGHDTPHKDFYGISLGGAY